jgi:3-oxoadipate enol-lactonase
MSYVDVNGIRLFYTELGYGSETVVFSHGFAMNHKMFAHQIKTLSAAYRVIAFDHRCHGQSDVISDAFDVYDLVEDAAGVIRALELGPVHFAGMSTGGFVALRLALQHPELVRSLILINTAAGAEDQAKIKKYQLHMCFCRILGLRILVSPILSRLMGRTFRSDPKRRDELRYWKDAIRKLDMKGISVFGHAIFNRDDVLEPLRSQSNLPPTLIIAGAEDTATPPDNARTIQSVIPHAKLTIIQSVGHTSPVENPEAVSERIMQFLSSLRQKHD